ncbi:MAG: SDR family NAD(P)-dependent oxidoreductase [Sutterellaceae bacterium]|nr:SDR family NAD(P)-dependent oxidoreductase [Burkholderiaceae bacterium]MDW8429539.1 SDR family NAD(P)-dependent oxidoreductase [Sutterellaceae bacterium]
MILVTGAAGFIGFHVAQALLARGDAVLGLDSLNDYYDPALKQARLAQLAHSRFIFERCDLADRAAVQAVFARHRIEAVVHLAAQAGVRYSLSHPHAYVDANVVGFLNLLEAVRARPVRHTVYASTSSVYGANTKLPFAVEDRVDQPVSLYAATKRADELMAYVYARQFGLVLTGLRFFTVYGPWGRPDMAAFKFTRAILAGEPIEVYNHGDMKRDFTYIDDVVDGLLRVLDRPPAPDENGVPHRLYNIGNHRPEPLLRFIEVLAAAVGRSPQMRMLPMQPGDVKETCADIGPLTRDYGWRPTTTIETGLPRFVAWYRQYYRV